VQLVFGRVRNNQSNGFVTQHAVHPDLKEGDWPLPILKAPPKQSKNESLQLRVSTEFKTKLQRYAEFLEATPSHVVTEALNRIFDKDREFKAWLEEYPNGITAAQTENNSTMETTREF
jgi:predicted transcriptional regulator